MNREAEEERLHELHFDLPQRLKEITVCARRATVVFDVCMYCECEFVVSKVAPPSRESSRDVDDGGTGCSASYEKAASYR